MDIESGVGFTPIGLSFLFLASVLIFFLPRKYLTIPIFATACYMTLGQKVIIFGFDFTLIRIVLLVCWSRLLIRKELFLFRPNINIIDKLFLCWVVASITTYTILYGTSNAFINRLGMAYNAIGTYFLFRYLIRDLSDINRVVKQLAIIIFPLAILMLFESLTGRNPFYSLGGVPEISAIRKGMVRCSGPFRAPHLAGTLGATLMPLFVSMWFNLKVKKLICVIGVIAATIITITSSSSGPVMAYGFAAIGLIMVPFRRYMRAIRWGVVFMLISLYLIMKAPVWYLIMRLSNVIGGVGWHRSYLIDQFFKRFNEWWLIGAVKISHWMPYGHPIDPDKIDITNQYIAQGVNGGLITMILFISIIVYCFKGVGRAMKENQMQAFSVKITLWSMGAALFAHVMNFLSVSYFDQINVFWFLLLAMISSLGTNSRKVKLAKLRNLKGSSFVSII